MKPLLSYITPRSIASFILILFCIQYIPIESRGGVSFLKLAVSAICPFIIIIYSPKIGKTMFLFILYYTMVILAAITHPESLRWSTVIFLGTFIITYLTFYNLVFFEHAFTKDFFRKLLERLIFAYFVVMLLQQFFITIGIKIFPLINLTDYLDRGIGCNSLSYEPSTAAIILSFSMLCLIRIIELNYGHKLTIKELYSEIKWPIIGFSWCMLTMGSGTAFICLGILICYFIKPRYFIYFTIFAILTYFAIMYIDFVPLQRARDSAIAFLSLDRQIISKADGSAAARIIPIVNTITELDLTSLETWFGHGVDYGTSKNLFSDIVMIGNIPDYGLFGYGILLIIVYTTMIKKFFSIETLLWFGILLGTLNNEPFRWGVMMLFTVVHYLQTQEERCFYCKQH